MTTIHPVPTADASAPEGLLPLQQWVEEHGAPPYIAFAKGAMDSLLDISNWVWVENRVQAMTPDYRDRIVAAHNRIAGEGMRVLGVAVRPLDAPPSDGDATQVEQDLIFIGLIAMIDPPRAEVKEAVRICLAAGIRPMMITGDHPLTAKHIAQELGIGTDGELITGQELNELNDAELDRTVDRVSIYARVSPEHKLNIVQSLQRKGQIVAMTGDGVNDAPALKRADIGVAMGITGTDVAKEAAEMVLQDDNFATIVAAVEEGRTIYDNVRKFIRYLLSCNSGEIWVMLLAPFLGMPLPLLPLQILWMNLVTDGLPALALGVEPAERNTMRRRPYPPSESIFSRGMGWDIIWMGLIMGLAPLALGYWYWSTGREDWRTMVFTTLVLAQMFLALAVRSERESTISIGFFANPAMLGAVALTFLLQMVVTYVPFAQRLFETDPLPPSHLMLSLALATLPFWVFEIVKWIRRRQRMT